MAGSTSGISPSFLGLSRSSGQVTHVLLTRSRLCPGPKPGSSLHLHVLSTPPAFVLSQDQTLREELLTKSCQNIHATPQVHAGRRMLTEMVMPSPRPDGRFDGFRTWTHPTGCIAHLGARAVEFSKTVAPRREGTPPS